MKYGKNILIALQVPGDRKFIINQNSQLNLLTIRIILPDDKINLRENRKNNKK